MGRSAWGYVHQSFELGLRPKDLWKGGDHWHHLPSTTQKLDLVYWQIQSSLVEQQAVFMGQEGKKSNVWLSESRTTMRFGPENRLEQIYTKANLSCPSAGQILTTMLHQGSLYPSLLCVIELLSLQPSKCLKHQVLDWVLEAKQKQANDCPSTNLNLLLSRILPRL